MALHPLVLLYNMDTQRRSRILPAAALLKIRCRNVSPNEYALPIKELINGAADNADTPENVFTDPMIVMSGFTPPLMNVFLDTIRRKGMKPVPLKAVVTPVNEQWDSIRLHSEIRSEHEAMNRK